VSSDDQNNYGVHLNDKEQEVHFPLGLAFDSELIPEGKHAPLKTLEEAAELTEAIKDQLKGQNDNSVDYDAYMALRQHTLEEFCDVYQTLVNIAFAFGFSQTEIEDAYMKVVRHNDERGRYPSNEWEESWLG
jgi:dimeric dUTPase (all-alpha-NTP-PPase superfamily)